MLYGILFTNIQLDDFSLTLAHFLEHIEIEGAEECVWIMMAIVNIGAMLDESFSPHAMRRLSCAVSCGHSLVVPVLSRPFSPVTPIQPRKAALAMRSHSFLAARALPDQFPLNTAGENGVLGAGSALPYSLDSQL